MKRAQAFVPSLLLAALAACGGPQQESAAVPGSDATAVSSPAGSLAEQPALPAPAATQTEMALPATAASAAAEDSTAAAPPSERLELAQAGDTGPAPGVSERFELGRHYRRLSPTQPTSSGADQVEVAEVFWYGCPHCYTFDPYIESWLAKKAAYVNFVRIPALWNPTLQVHARAFYTAEVLGKAQEMHTAFFREIHVNRNFLENEQKLQEFFGGFGVDAKTFTDTFNSFAVHTKMQRADELAKRYRISSVPTIIVNGKYTTDANSAGSYDALMELIDELAASEAAGG